MSGPKAANTFTYINHIHEPCPGLGLSLSPKFLSLSTYILDHLISRTLSTAVSVCDGQQLYRRASRRGLVAGRRPPISRPTKWWPRREPGGVSANVLQLSLTSQVTQETLKIDLIELQTTLKIRPPTSNSANFGGSFRSLRRSRMVIKLWPHTMLDMTWLPQMDTKGRM